MSPNCPCPRIGQQPDTSPLHVATCSYSSGNKGGGSEGQVAVSQDTWELQNGIGEIIRAQSNHECALAPGRFLSALDMVSRPAGNLGLCCSWPCSCLVSIHMVPALHSGGKQQQQGSLVASEISWVWAWAPACAPPSSTRPTLLTTSVCIMAHNSRDPKLSVCQGYRGSPILAHQKKATLYSAWTTGPGDRFVQSQGCWVGNRP